MAKARTQPIAMYKTVSLQDLRANPEKWSVYEVEDGIATGEVPPEGVRVQAEIETRGCVFNACAQFFPFTSMWAPHGSVGRGKIVRVSWRPWDTDELYPETNEELGRNG